MRGIKFVAVLAMVAAGVVPGHAASVSYGDIHAGLFLTIDAPDEYSAEVPITVKGYLLAAVGVIVEEAAVGIADEEIDIVVDGAVAATVTTDGTGYYEAGLVFDGAPPTTRTIQAVAFRGDVLETKSRSMQTHLDRFWAELAIRPSSVNVAPGASVQLRAWGLDEDGREGDLTDRVTWSTTDPSIASVSSGGVVTGVSDGSVSVTATLWHLTATAAVAVTG
jgi:hypothetical protein